MLNGNTIELGVCYYPEHWDTSFWKEDMPRMKSYGIGVIRVAEFGTSLSRRKGALMTAFGTAF